MKSHLILFALLLCLSACNSQPDLSKLTTAQWQEDIRFFMENAPKTHVNLYHAMPKADFDAYGEGLLKRLPQLNANQITAEMVRWVAALGDGHSHLIPDGGQAYPLGLFWFKEGLFVTNGAGDGEEFIGWQLLKINGLDMAEVARRVEPYQHRDNSQQIKAQAPIFLCSAEALLETGVIKSIGKIDFTFKNPATDEVRTVPLMPISRRTFFHVMPGKQPPAKALYRQKQDKKYWFTWLPESKMLYFQYNEMQGDEKEPVADFLKKLDEAVGKNLVEKFVVDLRWNGGGNLFTSKPVLDFIVNNPAINQRGKLFVVIGRHTFSAASWFATALEFRSKATFVGEPTGASPNHYGDTQRLSLPNSGLSPRLSTIYWQNSFPWDKRPATPPDLLVEPTAADWFADRDAALAAIFSFKTETSTAAPLPSGLREKVAGRYLLGEDKILEIKDLHGKLSLFVADFIEAELYATANGERLSSDVRSLFISPTGEGKISLKGMGDEVVLKKTPPGFRLPGEMILAGDLDGGIAALRALFHKTPKAASVQENQINTLGYQLMGAQKMDAAHAVLQLNTELYPNAFNTWDSLAEWHRNSGDKAKAIAFYKKSIALNPQNENGKRMLKKLE